MVRRRVAAVVAAVALVLFCAVTGFTVGVFFLPVAVGALVLAARGPRPAPSVPSAAGARAA